MLVLTFAGGLAPAARPVAGVTFREASEHGTVDVLGDRHVRHLGPRLVHALRAVARALGPPEQPSQPAGHLKLAAPRFQVSRHLVFLSRCGAGAGVIVPPVAASRHRPLVYLLTPVLAGRRHRE
jgi:hypothetical protein